MMRTLLALPAGAVALLVTAGFLGFLHPAFDTVGVFRPVLAVAAGLLALPALVLRARKAARLSLSALALALLGLLPHAADLRFAAHARPEPAALNVVTFNLLYYNQTREAAADWLLASGADVLLLQEVSRHNQKVREALREAYPHQLWCDWRDGGLAILSRLPVVSLQETCGDAEAAPGVIWMRVALLDGREVTAASLHLLWPWPWPQEEQSRAVAEVLAGLPRPLVVGGDFNASPWSQSFARVAEAAEAQALPGLRFTRMSPEMPIPLPIDHLLAGPELVTLSVGVGPRLGSDHLPVQATFGWAE